jgi:sulfur relay (sulfurtransferase) complex TusBCD TusD component (DsrE family)
VELAAAGVDVSLCEADAAMRGIHKSGQAGVFFGSLYDWARLAEDADRVLSFA